jgi:hypothetical protein
MSSCVTQVYDTSNANFQASVTLPYTDGFNGGEILGGFDTSYNQMIFAYENTCYPAKVNDLTYGWISPSPSYAVSTSKIGLDSNCPDPSANVLLYDTPSNYENFIIKQMVSVKDPLQQPGRENIIVCAGTCLTKSFTRYTYGFLFSFYLENGVPYTGFDGGISTGTTPNGWFIKVNGAVPAGDDFTEILTIYADYNINGNKSTIIYGGVKQESLSGATWSRPLLEKIEINTSGDVSTHEEPGNDFTDYDNPSVYTSIQAVDITPPLVNSAGRNDICMVIYQTIYQTLLNDNETLNVHIRALKFTDDKWYTDDYELPSTSAGGDNYNKMLYTSSCVSPPGKQYGSSYSPTMYISVTGTSSEIKTPMIYALNLLPPLLSPLNPPYINPNDLWNKGSGVYVYTLQGSNKSTPWNGLQIDNISYITESTMSRYVPVSTNSLFVTLSSITNPQTRYISFIAAITVPSTPLMPANQPNVTILDAIAKEEDPVWTLKKPPIINETYSYLIVELDTNLTGKLNDLQFKLNFCTNALYLFGFGNYVNSPAQASVSSGLLLNAISNICLSKGTQILCDQGIINIEKINTRKHTINNKQINHITQSIHTDDYLIKIKKNCLSSNSPSSDIICSGDHKILYKNNLIESKNLINEVYGIEKIKNDKRVLYNILMDKHEVIMANNTPVESLHPQNIIAMFYNNYNTPQAREFLSDKIGQMNKNNLYITEANKTNSIHLRNGTSKKTSIPLRIGNKK